MPNNTLSSLPMEESDFQADIKKLRNTVEFIDSLAQSGFSDISTIAKLALAKLEHPDGYRHPEVIAQALLAIWGKSDDIESCISSEAEQVGCKYIDDAQRRRWAAHSTAYQQESANVA